jgi:lysophospholipase L1-like esterase
MSAKRPALRLWIPTALVASIGLVILVAIFVLPRQNSATDPAPNRERDFYDWQTRHREVLELGRSGEADLVFIGDSITHLFGGQPESGSAVAPDVWEQHYGDRRVVNLGFGWDRTQNVLWRLQNGQLDRLQPRVAVVLIGTNNLVGTQSAGRNTPEETAEGVLRVCDEIQLRASDCQILLIGLLPRAPEKFTDPIRRINRLLAEGAASRGIRFLDLWPYFAGPDGLPRPELMADTVHPNRNGYEVWAEAMEPVLTEWLAPQDVR